jgi:hypothetical protein
MTPIGEITAAVGRPHDDVRDAGRDFMIAAGASVGLFGRVARDRAD